ncbi:MAG: hypothetical protein JWM87_3532 [Candidatus Eremiobacteraeota bacterium]|nr:hypothetical protein [Candidatus Eremiobacteraeota bacterium]
MDDRITDAIEQGRRNAQARLLFANHCLNGSIDLTSMGMLGRAEGLPIGHAEIRCRFAEPFNIQQYDHMALAMQFYEARCEGCTYRRPSGNLPTIVGEVEAARVQRAAADAEERKSKQAEEDAWTARQARREAAVLGQPYPVKDLARHLGLMDPKPGTVSSTEATEATEKARRSVVKSARQAPQLFSEPLVETLVARAKDLDAAAHTALRHLAERAAVDPGRVAQLAVGSLARSAMREAGQTVAAFAGTLSDDDVAAACRGAIWLAAEPEDGHDAREAGAEPAALLALAKRSWPAVREAVVSQLTSDEPWSREAAAHAARELVRDDAGRIAAFLMPLIRSIRGEDEGYFPSPKPTSAATRALAQCWLAEPDQAVDALEIAAPTVDAAIRELLADTPRRLLLNQDAEAPENARRSAIAFLVRRLDGGWGTNAAQDAIRELEYVAGRSPADLAPHLDTLFAALLDACAPMPAPSALAPRPHDLERQIAIRGHAARRDDLAEIVGRIAHAEPGAVLLRIFTLIDATAGDAELDETTRAVLVRALEHAVTSETIGRILPRLYTHLLRDEPTVRAAAVRLWAACARVAAPLPDELTALASQFIVDQDVHAEMVGVVQRLGLTDADARELYNSILAVVRAYRNGNADVLADAVYALLWSARSGPDDMRKHATAVALRVCRTLDPSTRKRLLLHCDLRPYITADAWGTAAIELLFDDTQKGYSISSRDDRILETLLGEPRGLAHVPLDLFRTLAAAYGNRRLGPISELVELLQRAERWRDAYTLASEVLATIPETIEYTRLRTWFSSVVDAAWSECATYEGTTVAAAQPVGDGPENTPEEDAVRLHVRARAAIRSVLTVVPVQDPVASAAVLDGAITVMTATGVDDARLNGYVEAVRIAALLLRHDAAARRGDAAGATAMLVAARRSASVALQAFDTWCSDEDPLRRFAASAANATTETVDELLRMLASVALALPLRDRTSQRRSRANAQLKPAKENDESEEEQPLVVCVLSLNGHPVFDTQVIYDDLLHDVTLDVRLDAWPAWAEVCRVRLLTTVSRDVLVAPEFEFRAADAIVDEYGLRLSQTHTLAFRAKRPPGAPPIDLTLQAVFTSPDGRHRETAIVAGYQRLRLRPYDPTRDVMTQHRQMDQRLLVMFAALYDDPTLDVRDVEAFCRFFTACVDAAQTTRFDKGFRVGTTVSETQFHDALEKALFTYPQLGGRLTRRDRVAGGFDDLLHDDIIAELKVEKKRYRAVEDCAKFIGQPTQYGVGRGSRLSILVVLDHSKKASPPAVLENDIGWLFPVQHGKDDPRYPSRVGVLVIPTNWPVPSEWSRRSNAMRPPGSRS